MTADISGTDEEPIMFAKISYTWSLMGASWDILKRDPRLLVFPLMSGVCCVLLLVSFGLPLISGGVNVQTPAATSTTDEFVRYGLAFTFYFANFFVITFFNTAIVACAVARMSGGEPTIGGGFAAALQRMHLILGWTLVSATVGLILRMIEERSEFIGRMVASLAGGAWSLVSYLVVPILVVEDKGPFAALKESAVLFRKTWGERIVGAFSFGVIFFLLSLPAWGLMLVAGYLWMTTRSHATAIACGAAAILYLIVLALVQSALQSIFQAAVYMYTRGVAGGRGFPVELLRDAMVVKD